jgi:hypothetical protein
MEHTRSRSPTERQLGDGVRFWRVSEELLPHAFIDLPGIVSGETPIIRFRVDPNWYQRYWLDEHPGSVQAPLLQALIGIAAKRILRLFRPMRNGGSASVDAGVPSSRDHIESVMLWSASLLG